MHTDTETLKGPGKKLGRTGRLAGRTATIAATVAALTVGGIAAANWTVDGGGTGSADATEALDLTIDLGLPESAFLYPGAELDGDLIVTNPNAFPIEITGVTFSGLVTVKPADPQPVAGTCDADDHKVTFEDRDLSSTPLVVPANETAFVLDAALAGAIKMANDAANACQGATFDSEFTVAAAIHIPTP